MSYQQFLGRFYLGTNANDLTIGSDPVELTTGYYYLCGYTGESVNQLCEHLQEKIRAIGATQDASTVVYDGSAGRVTITLETAAAITFNDTALASILGFASSLSSAAVHVGTAQPRYVWRPSRPAADYPHYLNSANLWNVRSTSISGRGPDGTVWGVAGNTLYDAVLNFIHLPAADVITPSTGTVYQDLKQFWQDVCHAVQPLRIYMDRTLATSANLVTGIVGNDKGDMLGSFSDFAQRRIKNYNGRWDVQLPIMKYI